MQTIPQRQNNIIQHNLILIHTAHHIHHNIAFGLVENDSVIVEDDVCALLGGLFQEAFLEGFLGFQIAVGRGGMMGVFWAGRGVS